MSSGEVLQRLASRLAAIRRLHTVRVAIDGVDGAGKTTLADALVGPIEACGRPVVRASIDGFHNPRRRRYRRGRWSPEGYYRDSFDYPALKSRLLEPLGPGGSGRFRRAVFDYRTDCPVEAPVEAVPDGALLLFDGVFLQRPELSGSWDAVVFVEAPFVVSVGRMAARDGAASDPDAPANRRYVGGQELYLRQCRPRQTADIVVDNADFGNPQILEARAITSEASSKHAHAGHPAARRER